MKKEKWHKTYKQTFIDRGIDEKFAEECLQSNIGDYEYDDDPESCALDEMSYWEN